MLHRNNICFRYITLNILYKGDNNNNNNYYYYYYYYNDPLPLLLLLVLLGRNQNNIFSVKPVPVHYDNNTFIPQFSRFRVDDEVTAIFS
jgi:hypothetical protein